MEINAFRFIFCIYSQHIFPERGRWGGGWEVKHPLGILQKSSDLPSLNDDEMSKKHAQGRTDAIITWHAPSLPLLGTCWQNIKHRTKCTERATLPFTLANDPVRCDLLIQIAYRHCCIHRRNQMQENLADGNIVELYTSCSLRSD